MKISRLQKEKNIEKKEKTIEKKDKTKMNDLNVDLKQNANKSQKPAEDKVSARKKEAVNKIQ